MDQDVKPNPPDWLFENIAEASKMAKRVYAIYLSMVLYTVVTIVSISDMQILLNSGVKLPILQVDVPLSVYTWCTPLMIVAIFAYMQVYLGQRRALIILLTSNFASVSRRRLYPWILNIETDPDSGVLGVTQVFFAHMFIFACMLPLLMFALLAEKLPGVRSGVGIIYSIFLYICLMGIMALSEEYHSVLKPKSFILRRGAIFSLVFLLVGVIIIFLSRNPSMRIFAFASTYYKLDNQILAKRPTYECQGKYWLYLDRARLAHASMRNTDISHTSMQKANLSEAKAQHAFFIGCDLGRANLEEGYFAQAYLDSTILDSAILRQGDFSGASITHSRLNWVRADSAIFRGADFDSSEFIGARMYGVDLSKANLTMCRFQNADLSYANLDSANVAGINLSYANLTGARLTNIDWPDVVLLRSAATLYKAEMDPYVREYIQSVRPWLLQPPKK